jgi:hypothetical protein
MARRYHRKNPLTSTQDLLLGGGIVATLALVGFSVYSKMTQAPTVTVNPFVNQTQSPATQAAAAGYNAGVLADQCPPGTTC